MNILKKLLGAAAIAVASFAPVAQADVVYEFSNPPTSGDPVGSPVNLPAGVVFAKATFSETATGLRLRMDVLANIGTATIDEWYFNVIAGVDASKLSWTNAGVAGQIDALAKTSNDAGSNCCSADGTGKYDFQVLFDEPSHQLSAGTFGVVDIISSDILLRLSDILGVSAPLGKNEGGGGGGFGAAVHVQEIGNGGSGWFTSACIPDPRTGVCETPEPPTGDTPEPGVLALLGIGLSALAVARRRRA